jgi:hypothetical protein
MQVLRNFVGYDYSTDEGTDSEEEQVPDGGDHARVGTGGEIKQIESGKGAPCWSAEVGS